MKRICFITSTRADYGLLKWSMKSVQDSPNFDLQIIAMGMHLSKKFGETYHEIEKDGFLIQEKVFFDELKDARDSVLQQVSTAMIGTAGALDRLQPDLVVILGDRYEMLGAAQAAFFQNLPIVHIHGGEITEGAIDDSIRHCLTKLSQYHLTSTEVYRQRVIQLGEPPDRVFTLGAPGLENFNRLALMSREDLQKSLPFDFKKQNILFTFHPVTASLAKPESIEEVLLALSHFPNVGQILTLPNSDLGHEYIFDRLQKYVFENRNVFLTQSLGQLRYLSLLSVVDLVVGNSSSGIIEAPFLGTRTLNIGKRQYRRMSADSVTHVECESQKIQDQISELLLRPKKNVPSMIYGDGHFSEKFMQILQQVNFKNSAKAFYDLPQLHSEKNK